MVNDVLLNKSASIERCVARAQEEYYKDPETFSADFTRQDAAILNIQRACEAALDLGNHLIRQHKLGLPQSSREVFCVLAQANIIPKKLAERLKNMVGFRNIAVHDYQTLQLPITIAIIEHHLSDFLEFSALLLRHEKASHTA
ncbi:type VII toxin-antitoxin system HepT family RNase toxin [Nitrincola tapanii]|uniref:DUF86 domain-containing protein n=1 Tax=Nitrincola tapanii TaxID=1708751 RepID=A0A5A9W782_9GAMM|nr:DUF86 domain-containing protein [Nitrincola tapanii]KAA0876596.1 DUF86 domain-containing protein [Nitrincola tapanii]